MNRRLSNLAVDFSLIDGIETIVKIPRKIVKKEQATELSTEQSVERTLESTNPVTLTEATKGYHSNAHKYMALSKVNHVKKLHDEYNKTDILMRDYRMSLLSSLI